MASQYLYNGAHPTWPKDGIGILSYQVQVLLWNPKAAGKTGPFGWKSWPGLFDCFDSRPRSWCKSVVNHVVEPRSYALSLRIRSYQNWGPIIDKSTHDPRSRSTSASLQLHLRCLSPLQLVMLRDAWSSLNMHMSAIWTSEPQKKGVSNSPTIAFRNHPSPESHPVPRLSGHVRLSNGCLNPNSLEFPPTRDRHFFSYRWWAAQQLRTPLPFPLALANSPYRGQEARDDWCCGRWRPIRLHPLWTSALPNLQYRRRDKQHWLSILQRHGWDLCKSKNKI